MRGKAQRKFARFYYAEFKRDYPDIYADDVAFSAWARLLVASEESWPARPELPRSIRPKAIRTLADRGLVDVTGLSFAIKGFAVERARRQEAAQVGATSRWDADADARADAIAGANGHARGDALAMPSTSTSTREAIQGVIVERRAPVDGLVKP